MADQDSTPKKLTLSDTEDSCCICRDNTFILPRNDILICRTCKAVFHTDCYSLSRVPSNGNRFYCDQHISYCTIRNGRERCKLCEVREPGLYRFTTLMDQSDTQELVHQVCAMFVPGAEFAMDRNGHVDLSKVATPEQKQACAICRGKQGHQFKCAAPDCKRTLHASCAHSKDLTEFKHLPYGEGVKACRLYCPQHKSMVDTSVPDRIPADLRDQLEPPSPEKQPQNADLTPAADPAHLEAEQVQLAQSTTTRTAGAGTKISNASSRSTSQPGTPLLGSTATSNPAAEKSKRSTPVSEIALGAKKPKSQPRAKTQPAETKTAAKRRRSRSAKATSSARSSARSSRANTPTGRTASPQVMSTGRRGRPVKYTGMDDDDDDDDDDFEEADDDDDEPLAKLVQVSTNHRVKAKLPVFKLPYEQSTQQHLSKALPQLVSTVEAATMPLSKADPQAKLLNLNKAAALMEQAQKAVDQATAIKTSASYKQDTNDFFSLNKALGLPANAQMTDLQARAAQAEEERRELEITANLILMALAPPGFQVDPTDLVGSLQRLPPPASATSSEDPK
eukprot:TRINITY_DN11674_c1_g1_i2.p1 TRINITY_DN11674_c1_g1~~TRINITY_DN11674_c1_g1_i2.p1  ORF type:complete len:564 (+),score=91.47 TRINITY_DN11674_c1_g1_i2:74-1765(+)